MASEPEYEVEDILEERYDSKKRAVVYHVKWKDWPEEENTWETGEDLKDDGYEAALRKYEARKVKLNTPTKKATTSRSARSKTPVKRTIVATSAAKKKPSSKTPEKAKESPVKATPVKSSPAKASALRRKSPEKTVEPERTVTVIEEIPQESRGNLKGLLIASILIGLTIAVALEEDAFNFTSGDVVADLLPLVIALIVVRFFGSVHSVVSRASLTLLWVIFARLLNVPALQAPASLKGVSEFAWRYFFAKAVGADMADREVLVVSGLSWYLFTYVPTSSTLANMASLASVWAVITTVERWTLFMSILNFIEAGASCALLVSRFTDEAVIVWVACGLLAVSSVARTVAPYQ